MAKIYSPDEIDSLNLNRQAVIGQEYTDSRGLVFVGVEDNRLRLKASAKNVIHAPSNSNLATDVQKAIDNVGIDIQVLKTRNPIAVKNVAGDYQMLLEDDTVVVSPDNNTLNIKLPSPGLCINTHNDITYSKSFNIQNGAINKGQVKILPFSVEKIMNEDYQILKTKNDNLTLVTDGVNWFER